MAVQMKLARAKVSPVRQRTQYSCMTASMMMCLQALGHDCTEDEVNRVMGAKPMKGAAWEDALACAQHYGCRATLTVPATVRQLKKWTDAGIPIMIAWNPEGRDWSHASVVYHAAEGPLKTWSSDQVIEGDGPGLYVWVADPNIPNPDKTTRVVHEDEFYKRWFEKWPNYLVRRPACAIDREITAGGRQVVASSRASGVSAERVAARYRRPYQRYKTRERRREMNVGEISDWEARKEQREIDRREKQWWARAVKVVEAIGTRQEQEQLKKYRWPQDNWTMDDRGARRELKKELGQKYGAHLTDTGFKLFQERREYADLTDEEWQRHSDSIQSVDINLGKPAKWLLRQITSADPELQFKIGNAERFTKATAWGSDLSPNYPERVTVTVGALWEIPIYLVDPSLGRRGAEFVLLLGHFRYWDDRDVRFLGLFKGSVLGDAVVSDATKPIASHLNEAALSDRPLIEDMVRPLTTYFRGFLDEARAAAAARAKPKPRKPRAPKTVVDSAVAEKIRILDELAAKVSGWPEGLAHVEAVKAAYEAGRQPSPDDLKKIRNYLYRNRMRDEANHFRQAADAAHVACRYLERT